MGKISLFSSELFCLLYRSLIRRGVNMPMSYMEKYIYFTVSLSSCENENVIGYLDCLYLKNSIEFHGFTELILTMDQIMQDCHVPKYDVRYRTFYVRHQKITNQLEYKNIVSKIMEENLKTSFLNLENKKNSFLVEIMYRQNYSWQGKITWIQKNRTRMFRSALEFLHILYSIMDEVNK